MYFYICLTKVFLIEVKTVLCKSKSLILILSLFLSLDAFCFIDTRLNIVKYTVNKSNTTVM